MKKGFTLLEMLIVIGIISILTAASVVGFSHVLKAGENARARELVSQVATAFTALFDNDGVWPKAIRDKGAGGGLVDEKIAYCLRDQFSVQVDGSSEQTIGYDRFGIVTPWALARIKRLGTAASLDSKVGSASIQDHILRFAVDLDGDGIIEGVNLSVGGGSKARSGQGISVRATAIVWCCNKDGEILDYQTGVKKDGIYSWSYGQTLNVK